MRIGEIPGLMPKDEVRKHTIDMRTATISSIVELVGSGEITAIEGATRLAELAGKAGAGAQILCQQAQYESSQRQG